MAAGVGEPLGSGHGKIRAADADRDRVAGILGTAYSEGRLSKDEYDSIRSQWKSTAGNDWVGQV